jgi:hypothetical protein
MIASAIAFTPTWIALGVLGIAATAAVAIVGIEPRTARSR